MPVQEHRFAPPFSIVCLLRIVSVGAQRFAEDDFLQSCLVGSTGGNLIVHSQRVESADKTSVPRVLVGVVQRRRERVPRRSVATIIADEGLVSGSGIPSSIGGGGPQRAQGMVELRLPLSYPPHRYGLHERDLRFQILQVGNEPPGIRVAPTLVGYHEFDVTAVAGGEGVVDPGKVRIRVDGAVTPPSIGVVDIPNDARGKFPSSVEVRKPLEHVALEVMVQRFRVRRGEYPLGAVRASSGLIVHYRISIHNILPTGRVRDVR